MERMRPWLALVALLPLAGLPLASQEKPADQARPVFRSGVNIVRLDVRVVDEAGRPLTDLTQDEFQVIDAGTARPVVLFQRVAGAGQSYVELAQRTIASTISTNQNAPQGQLFVFLVDQDHIRPGGEQPVRTAVDAFLRDHVRPQDRVAVYGLPGPGPAQAFTANLAQARVQLASLRGGLERRQAGAVTEMSTADAYEIVRGNEKVLARFTTFDTTTTVAAGGSAGTAAASDVARRAGEDPAVLRRLLRENAQSVVVRADAAARTFLKAAADLLRSFRGIDGRKTIVLFSEGFYADNVGREIEDLAAAAAETYSVIYAFDLNRRSDVISAEGSTADEGLETTNRIEPLGSLAAETSGDLLLQAGPRLEAALGGFLPDDGGYYLIGFQPGPQESGDGVYRRATVRVTRPGARVISRTGYAVHSTAAPLDKKRAIDQALAAPFTQQGLKLEYTTYVGPSASGLQRVAVSLNAELPFAAADAGSERQAADVVFVVRDSRSGRVAASGTDRLPLPLPSSTSSSSGTASWRVAFDLPSGEYLMRCIVREPGGIIGSADRRFSVRPLGGLDVATTDLVIVTPGEPFPVRARGYTDSTLAGTVRVFGPASSKLGQLAGRVTLVPAHASDDMTVGRTADAVVGELVSSGWGVLRDVSFSLPLEHLAAGPYIARLVVRAEGEVVADLARPVDIVLGAPPAPPVAAPAEPRQVLDGDIARRLIERLAAHPNGVVARAASDVGSARFAEALAITAALASDDLAALAARGLAWLGQGEYRQAAAALGQAFEASSRDAALAFVLGWARRGAADGTGAVTAFRSAILHEPSMVAAHLALADTYLALGRPELAILAVEAGLRELPASRELSALLARIKK
jgi:VWFA-related protein